MTVKKAAALLGVHPETLRRWDWKGKLKTRRHPMSGYRIYSEEEVRRLIARIGKP